FLRPSSAERTGSSRGERGHGVGQQVPVSTQAATGDPCSRAHRGRWSDTRGERLDRAFPGGSFQSSPGFGQATRVYKGPPPDFGEDLPARPCREGQEGGTGPGHVGGGPGRGGIGPRRRTQTADRKQTV